MTGNQFALKVNDRVLYFDTDGEVWDAANQAGTWNTDDTNQVVFKAGDGTTTAIPVTWRFDQDNYLWLDQNNTPVHQFGGTEGPVAKFTLDKNVLTIDPDINDTNDFTFQLHAKWGLLDDGSLQVTFGQQVSQIDGYLESNDSGFSYRFVQLDYGAVPMAWNLKFSGQWEKSQDDKRLLLHFKLDDPTLEDHTHPLDLPAAVGVDPKRNNLVFQFSQNGRNHQILFQGSLQIQNDWTLSFTIKDSKDGNVSTSLIQVQTSFEFDADDSGNLVFYVGQQKAPDRQVLTIGGELNLKLGQAGLDITFKYSSQTGSAATTSMVLAVGGQFTWNGGQDTLSFSYTQNGASLTLDVTAKVVLGSAAVSGGISITNDPNGQKVTAFLSVSF